MVTITSYSNLAVLIIDDMPVQQTTLRGYLQLLGISRADVASSAEDALKLIRSRKYQLILCDYNLNNRTDGQQLFEYLREQQLLPHDCLFFMITAEGSYASVAATTEHYPDAYLLKPITAADLDERLRAMLDKRDALVPITTLLSKGNLAGAVEQCDKLMASRSRWFMSALQIKAQALLKLGRHEDAKQVYLAALQQRADLIWAKLGLARALKAAGAFEEARQCAQDILDSRDGQRNVAAFDVLAESLEAMGDPEGAMWVLKEASMVVPSARRFRMVGESAYRNGHLDAAKDALVKANKSSRGSVVAQHHDALLLSQALVDIGENAEALKVLNEAAPFHKNEPAFAPVALAIQAQAEAQAGDKERAEATLQKARALALQGKADFATVALAKAELVNGHEQAGFTLLEKAIASDHENTRMRQLIGKALRETGHDDKVEALIDSAMAGIESKVTDARKLLRNNQIDEAVEAIEQAVHDHPENTGVLLQAAQINCLALRLKRVRQPDLVERATHYLGRLEKLLPSNDRVTQMQRYFRETLTLLDAGTTPP